MWKDRQTRDDIWGFTGLDTNSLNVTAGIYTYIDH